jgi:hypothetical protein
MVCVIKVDDYFEETVLKTEELASLLITPVYRNLVIVVHVLSVYFSDLFDFLFGDIRPQHKQPHHRGLSGQKITDERHVPLAFLPLHLSFELT